uniref:NADH-ubiquinone oxidoreductase chain 3 n=1 Tax=Disteniidae sp. BMNH 899837 TaxID=1903814 RepID=A0A343A4F0_9CUCU|nr:NADH dehydrogenase subunit 3 [Disteniidae sp. BMNH 899837]
MNLSIMVLSILIILLMILNFIAKKTFSDQEKSSPFECGFSPKSPSRLPFSLQFFLIGIIFLIFDVEITLLLPMIKILYISDPMMYWMTLTAFLIILIAGVIHEWNQGALDWIK